MKVAAIIELDDYTHNYHDKDKTRDSLLRSVGYRVERFDVKNKLSVDEMRFKVLGDSINPIN